MKILISVAIVWLLACGIILLQMAPHFPSTTLQWVLLLVLGPPLYVVGEAFGEWFFSRERGYRISPKSFSFLRLAYALVIVLLIVAAGDIILAVIKDIV